MKQILLFILNFFIVYFSVAQQSNVLIHSHNDYERKEPFHKAYSQRAYSIEVDVFSENGKLLVAHSRSELKDDITLEKLYILPIVDKFNNGTGWHSFVLLIDLKTPAEITLNNVIKAISAYPNVFDRTKNPRAVQVVISGAMPKPEEFELYSGIVSFDGRVSNDYTAQQLDRVPFFSFPFTDYSKWRGEGPLPPEDKEKLMSVIKSVHSLGKKVRFWASPDNIRGWETLHSLGVDIINTDDVEKCKDYFNRSSSKVR